MIAKLFGATILAFFGTFCLVQLYRGVTIGEISHNKLGLVFGRLTHKKQFWFGMVIYGLMFLACITMDVLLFAFQ